MADKDITCVDEDLQTAFVQVEDYKYLALLMFTALPKVKKHRDQNKKRFVLAPPADREFINQKGMEIGLVLINHEKITQPFPNLLSKATVKVLRLQKIK
jgi:hypothetical protein